MLDEIGIWDSISFIRQPSSLMVSSSPYQQKADQGDDARHCCGYDSNESP
jgi:hypothetical protein